MGQPTKFKPLHKLFQKVILVHVYSKGLTSFPDQVSIKIQVKCRTLPLDVSSLGVYSYITSLMTAFPGWDEPAVTRPGPPNVAENLHFLCPSLQPAPRLTPGSPLAISLRKRFPFPWGWVKSALLAMSPCTTAAREWAKKLSSMGNWVKSFKWFSVCALWI